MNPEIKQEPVAAEARTTEMLQLGRSNVLEQTGAFGDQIKAVPFAQGGKGNGQEDFSKTLGGIDFQRKVAGTRNAELNIDTQNSGGLTDEDFDNIEKADRQLRTNGSTVKLWDVSQEDMNKAIERFGEARAHEMFTLKTNVYQEVAKAMKNDEASEEIGAEKSVKATVAPNKEEDKKDAAEIQATMAA